MGFCECEFLNLWDVACFILESIQAWMGILPNNDEAKMTNVNNGYVNNN